MGSIVRNREGWRAHLCVDGKRESQTFRTQREARAWAERRESEMRAGASAATFGQVAEDWLALKLPSLDNAANQRTVEQSIREHVLPTLGHRKLAEITRPELVDLVRGIAARGTVETSHRVGQRIANIFDLAVDRGDIKSHVAADLARVLPARRKRRMPAVRPEELPDLMAAIHTYPEPITRIGLLLLAHTFTRTTELIRAEWEHIRDPETWVIPEERMKGEKDKRLLHVVPLSKQVRWLLEEARALGNGSSYFLASEMNPMCGISSNTLLYALYRLGYRGRMTGHGFRAVASTVLNESKLWHKDAIERQLHHGETDDVRAAYHRAEYLDERRQMMQWWSSHLESLAAKTAS
jgi:integrase